MATQRSKVSLDVALNLEYQEASRDVNLFTKGLKQSLKAGDLDIDTSDAVRKIKEVIALDEQAKKRIAAPNARATGLKRQYDDFVAPQQKAQAKQNVFDQRQARNDFNRNDLLEAAYRRSGRFTENDKITKDIVASSIANSNIIGPVPLNQKIVNNAIKARDKAVADDFARVSFAKSNNVGLSKADQSIHSQLIKGFRSYSMESSGIGQYNNAAWKNTERNLRSKVEDATKYVQSLTKIGDGFGKLVHRMESELNGIIQSVETKRRAAVNSGFKNSQVLSGFKDSNSFKDAIAGATNREDLTRIMRSKAIEYGNIKNKTDEDRELFGQYKDTVKARAQQITGGNRTARDDERVAKRNAQRAAREAESNANKNANLQAKVDADAERYRAQAARTARKAEDDELMQLFKNAENNQKQWDKEDQRKKRFGSKPPNTPPNGRKPRPYGRLYNSGINTANHLVTNAAQIAGTSLYGLGIAGATVGLVKSSIGKEIEIENTQRVLAGMTNQYNQFVDAQGKSVSNAENLNKSLQYSKTLYGKLRDQASKGLVNTQDLAEGYATGAPQMKSKGLNDDQILKVVNQITTLGRAMGYQPTAITSDIRDFGRGAVTTRSQILSAVLGTKPEQEKFTKLTKEGKGQEAYAYFQSKFKGYQAAFNGIENSPQGQLNKLGIEFEKLQQTMGQTLVPIIIPELEKFRGFLEKWVASGQAQKFAESLGNLVAQTIQVGTSLLSFLGPFISDFRSLLLVGFVGTLAGMAAKTAAISFAMSNPVTAILAALGALVGGIAIYAVKAKQEADKMSNKTIGGYLDPNDVDQKANAQLQAGQYLAEKARSGIVGENAVPRSLRDNPANAKEIGNLLSQRGLLKTYFGSDDYGAAAIGIKDLAGRVQSGLRGAQEYSSPQARANGVRQNTPENARKIYDSLVQKYGQTEGFKYIRAVSKGLINNLEDFTPANVDRVLGPILSAFANGETEAGKQRMSDVNFATGGGVDLAKQGPALLDKYSKEMFKKSYASLVDPNNIQAVRERVASVYDGTDRMIPRPGDKGEVDATKTPAPVMPPMEPTRTSRSEAYSAYLGYRQNMVQNRYDVLAEGDANRIPIAGQLAGLGYGAAKAQWQGALSDAVINNKGQYAFQAADFEFKKSVTEISKSYDAQIRQINETISVRREEIQLTRASNQLRQNEIALLQNAKQMRTADYTTPEGRAAATRNFEQFSKLSYSGQVIQNGIDYYNTVGKKENALGRGAMGSQAIMSSRGLSIPGFLSPDMPGSFDPRRDAVGLGLQNAQFQLEKTKYVKTGKDTNGKALYKTVTPAQRAVGSPIGTSSGLNQTAANLGVDPADLAAIINFESGGNPHNVNGSSGATGLIQFMPSTARGLGTTTGALRGMSYNQQLPYVEKYLRGNGVRSGMGLEDMYMSVLWPAGIGKPSDSVIFARGSAAYRQNSNLDINRDGAVTKAEAASFVMKRRGRSSGRSGGTPIQTMSDVYTGARSQNVGAAESFATGANPNLVLGGGIPMYNGAIPITAQDREGIRTDRISAGLSKTMGYEQTEENVYQGFLSKVFDPISQQITGRSELAGQLAAGRIGLRGRELTQYNRLANAQIGSRNAQDFATQQTAMLKNNIYNYSKSSALMAGTVLPYGIKISTTDKLIEGGSDMIQNRINGAQNTEAQVRAQNERETQLYNALDTAVQGTIDNLSRLSDLNFDKFVRNVGNGGAYTNREDRFGQAFQNAQDSATASVDERLRNRAVAASLGGIDVNSTKFQQEQAKLRIEYMNSERDKLKGQFTVAGMQNARFQDALQNTGIGLLGALGTGFRPQGVDSAFSSLSGLFGDRSSSLNNQAFSRLFQKTNPFAGGSLFGARIPDQMSRRDALITTFGGTAAGLAGNFLSRQLSPKSDPMFSQLGGNIGSGLAGVGGIFGKAGLGGLGAAAGPVGMVAGSLLGGVLGGLFGGKRKTIDPAVEAHQKRLEEILSRIDKSLRPQSDYFRTVNSNALFGSSSGWYSGRNQSRIGIQGSLGER